MTEPSVEEIVAKWEKSGHIADSAIDALIADWRKRGEALMESESILGTLALSSIRRALIVIRAALTPQQPPSA